MAMIAKALRPPSIDRLLGRENCVSLGASNRAFQWFGRCVNYPSPLAPANGNFDLVPDAAVLQGLGTPSAQFHHVPHGSRERCGGRRLSADDGHANPGEHSVATTSLAANAI